MSNPENAGENEHEADSSEHESNTTDRDDDPWTEIGEVLYHEEQDKYSVAVKDSDHLPNTRLISFGMGDSPIEAAQDFVATLAKSSDRFQEIEPGYSPADVAVGERLHIKSPDEKGATRVFTGTIASVDDDADGQCGLLVDIDDELWEIGNALDEMDPVSDGAHDEPADIQAVYKEVYVDEQ